jgi:hypothetical protein
MKVSLTLIFSFICSTISLAQVYTYHSASSAEHQANFTKYINQGLRLQTLSVHGHLSQHNYAAVWVKETGPAWSGFHHLAIKDYQKLFDDNSKKGFCPKLLSVAGFHGDETVTTLKKNC